MKENSCYEIHSIANFLAGIEEQLGRNIYNSALGLFSVLSLKIQRLREMLQDDTGPILLHRMKKCGQCSYEKVHQRLAYM